MKTTILWFRRDLRLHDNPAIKWACENSESILPVYIYSPVEEKPWAPGSASRWWLHNSLLELDGRLQDYGMRLNFYSGESWKILSGLVAECGANAIVFNKLYEPHLHKRDEKLHEKLGARVEIKSLDSGLLSLPGKLLNNQQKPYRVFTPFYRKVRQQLDVSVTGQDVWRPENHLKRVMMPEVSSGVLLNMLGLLDNNKWSDKLHKYWKPGEKNGLYRLDRFIGDNAGVYSTNRDVPAIKGTSTLSPSLHFGEVTPAQVYDGLRPMLNGAYGEKRIESAEVFLKQLIWREFAHHVLWNFPCTATEPMDRRYKKSFWRFNKKKFNLWTMGQTGVPIVDAGMKQLWETGWMHNRVRMIASSFLTKNLGISWLDGARWFWDTLIDADLANNNMGWQWVAGCGVDAAPYYRIFNPITQQQRFDADSKYIDTWAPQYRHMSYTPATDIAQSRSTALERYKKHIL